MSWWEILIIVAAVLFVAGVVALQIVRKKQGKGGCDCGCASCPHCTSCHASAPKKKP